MDQGEPPDRLSDTLLRVPQLLHTCLAAWKQGRTRPYDGVYRTQSPVKTLRMVGKAFGCLAQEAKSFSVMLGTPLHLVRESMRAGLPNQLPAAVQLLCNAQLQNLEVIFDFEPAFYEEDLSDNISQDPNQQADILSQDLIHIDSAAAQIQTLVDGLGPALNSITFLALSSLTGASDGAVIAFTAALGATVLPLAAACPRIEKLRLDGDFGVAAITALGQAFPSLRRLELTPHGVPITTVVTLKDVFPYLTHLSVVDSYHSRFEVTQEEKSIYMHAALVSLSSFTTLTHLQAKYNDSPPYNETWHLLPPNLQELTIGEMFTCNVPEDLQILSLRRLELECDSRDTSLLETILQVAPNLRQLNALVNLKLSWNDRDLWIMLSERMKEGLGFDDCNVRLTTGPHPSELLSDLLPLLTPLPAVGYLIATIRTKILSMKELARVFPNLVSLNLICVGTTESALRELGVCAALKSLQVKGASPVIIQDPVQFCRSLPALKDFTFGGCGAAVVATLPGMQANWNALGLEVRLDMREYEGYAYDTE